jgi:nucleoid-associated protein YgaU
MAVCYAMNKSTEEVVSMFLGLVIVVVAVGLIFTYFQRKRGVVSVPGISQTLVKPTETIVKTEIEGTTYTVIKGDNLWKIAQKYYGSGYNWVDISKINKLSKPNELAVGQKLILPKVEVKTVVTATTTVKPVQEKIDIGNYKVVRGDSLWKIAVRTYGDGFQWVQIWKSNKLKLKDPNKLEIGMELILPKLQ